MSTYITGEGIVRARVRADTAYMYSGTQSAELRNVHVTFYDDRGAQTSTLTSREGTYHTRSGEMEARGNAVVITTYGRTLRSEVMRYSEAKSQVSSYKTFTCDSVAWYSTQRRFDMIGRVKIRDTSRALDANLAYYYLREERLEAHNNVVAKNRVNGSTLRGPNLNYLRAAPGIRDTLEMFATQRPTIDFRGQADSSEPYVIVGDRVHFRGNDRMWAGGNVTVDRSDLAAQADSMAVDQTAGRSVLIGKPKVQGKGARSYTLVGRRIELLQQGRELKRVDALGAGQAFGTDWHPTADTIRMGIANSQP